MKRFIIILFNVTVWFSVLCKEVSASVDKKQSSIFSLKHETALQCETKLCIPKCCPEGFYLRGMKRECFKNSSIRGNFSELPLYYNNLTRKGRTLNDITMVPGRLLHTEFNSTSFDLAFHSTRPNYYLTEKGILYSEMPNTYDRWTTYNKSQFCVDYTLRMPYYKVYQPELRFITKIMDNNPETTENKSTAISYCLVVSVIFMALVLLVYAILPELRNLCGKVLMAYVFSLMSAFILLIVNQVSESDNEVKLCKGLTIAIYFLFLASFCWMNIMSYDIWWTFRGYAKARSINRKGENFKFGMYCIYAFGLPAALTILLVVLDEMNLRHLPWFIKPNINMSNCFMGEMEKFFYLYIPMLILIGCNWLFFLMTAFNIWRLHRATLILDSAAAGGPAAHRKQKYRFFIYLKLSIIMGINWILEGVSSFSPDFKGWYVSDFFNILIGLSIFLIFVCKKKIFMKLRKRIRGVTEWKAMHSWTSKKSQSSNTSKSDVSQEMQVCNNPKGYKRYEISVGDSTL